MELNALMAQLGGQARAAAAVLAQLPADVKTRGLHAAAAAIRAQAAGILAANAKDMNAAQHLDAAMRDRLLLDAKRVDTMAHAVATIADLPDPVGRVLAQWDVAASQLHFEKTAVPLGVIGIIYESRPNVTADAAALAIKAGNAVILRGGSESFHSSQAILAAFHDGLAQANIPLTAAQYVPTTDRDAVDYMLTTHGMLDVLIPRGGKSLTERVQREARVPTLLHLDGNCHIYVDSAVHAVDAQAIILNAKLRRTGVCGALETLLIHQDALEALKPTLQSLLDQGCELRGDASVQSCDARIVAATAQDWTTEYLAPILAVKTVASLDDAIAHINRYGSHHTDAILTNDAAAAAQFIREVDSAIVMVNASTQFADGGEFGFGGEIGIATGRLHARGPVGAPELTTYKYVITSTAAHGSLRAV